MADVLLDISNILLRPDETEEVVINNHDQRDQPDAATLPPVPPEAPARIETSTRYAESDRSHLDDEGEYGVQNTALYRNERINL